MTEESTTRRLEPGAIVDDEYEIVEWLGKGATATVYRARHLHSRREVAIKILTVIEFVDEADAEIFRERFTREARAAAAVQHANIATFFSCGFTKERLYIAMQLLEGHELSVELAQSGAMSPRRALVLFKDCLYALGVVHRNGIVHRDLGPRNLFVDHPGTPKEALVLMDFGVALIDDGDIQKRLTRPGQVLGTPAYTSSEAFKADLSIPARDVYAMGLLLAESLIGRPLIDSNDLFTCMEIHCKGRLEVPRWLMESPLGPTLTRALSVDHEQRFVDAKAFADAIAAIDPDTIVVGDHDDRIPVAEIEVDQEILPPRQSIPRAEAIARTDDNDDVAVLLKKRAGKQDWPLVIAVVLLLVVGVIAVALLAT